jgi:hypothetical protein
MKTPMLSRLIPALAAATLLHAGSVLSGCSSCRKGPEKTGAETKADALQVPQEPAEKKTHTAVAPILPEAVIKASKGPFKLVHTESQPGVPVLPGEEGRLYIGDHVIAEDGTEVEIEFTGGGSLALHGKGEVMIGIHFPAEIVVIQGAATIETEQLKGRTRRIKIQTPGGTYFHAGPASEIAVAASGATRIFVKDCPPSEGTGAAAKTEETTGLTCAALTDGEERPLATGDVLTIDARLGVAVLQGQTAPKPKADEWLKAENDAFQKEQAKILDWFLKWTTQGIDGIDEMLAQMENLRLSNKDAIDQLKLLRQTTKPDAAGAPKKGEKKAGDVEGEMNALKMKLAENSKQMARTREAILARWYQLNLRWEAFGDLLTDEILAKAGKEKPVLLAFFKSYEDKLLKLVKRRPRRQMPAKFPVPSIQSSPFAPDSKKLKPVAPSK